MCTAVARHANGYYQEVYHDWYMFKCTYLWVNLRSQKSHPCCAEVQTSLSYICWFSWWTLTFSGDLKIRCMYFCNDIVRYMKLSLISRLSWSRPWYGPIIAGLPHLSLIGVKLIGNVTSEVGVAVTRNSALWPTPPTWLHNIMILNTSHSNQYESLKCQLHVGHVKRCQHHG